MKSLSMKGDSLIVKRPPTKLQLPSRWARFAVCTGLIALIWIAFGQTLAYDFVNYDDKTYVYGNSLVSAGLTIHGLLQAFVDTQTTNWHPLTLISHMIDYEIFGLKPGGHHFTNLLLHSIAAVLLFVWLNRITGNMWRSAFVTALFAIHPLRVESVAWIAERKDVLSAAFFFLTLLAYARYTQTRSVGRYLMLSILFACGLMSKPMLVTTPVILLLLDYWPLQRWTDLKSFWRLAIEKLPLFALSTASSIVTFVLQERSMGAIAQLPLAWRLKNAFVSCIVYLGQIFWPSDLAVFYPHPEDTLPLWQVALAGALLIGVTWTAYALRGTRPYLLVGWLWYLVMLFPVIGIVEVGLHGHADRYTYLPHAGIYVAVTWLVADFAISLRLRKEILGAAGAVVVVALAACARKQTTYWRNSETLWKHTLAVTENNDVALTNLANWFMDHDQLDDALSYFQRALAVHSNMSGHQHYNLSHALIYSCVGNVLARKGRLDEAISHFQQAIALRPDYPDPHYNLGVVLLERRDVDGAMAEFRTILALYPKDSEANTALANALVQKGLFQEAADHFEIALKSEPDSALALNNLAWLLSTGPDDSVRNGPRAVELALELNRISNHKNPSFIRTLAAAYAEAGQFGNAAEAAQTASSLARVQGQHSLAARLEQETDLYRGHLPLRDRTLANAQ
jgi:tetratricopeptide (TPR) repeat protein